MAQLLVQNAKGYISEKRSSSCTICPAGTIELNNNECRKCSKGFYSPFNGSISCTECPSGYISEEGSSSCTIC